MRSINGAVLRSAFAMVLGFVLVLWPEAAITYLVITIGILFIYRDYSLSSAISPDRRTRTGRNRCFLSRQREAYCSERGCDHARVLREYINVLTRSLISNCRCTAIGSLISARKWSNVPLGFYLMPALILITGVMILAYPFGAAANTFVIFGVASIFYGGL